MTTTPAELRASMRENLIKAKAIAAAAEEEHRSLSESEEHQLEQLVSTAADAKKQLAGIEVDRKAAEIVGGLSGSGAGLLAQFKSAGWAPGKRVEIDDPGTRAKAASFDGSLDALSPARFDGVPLGAEQRFIHTAFSVQAVDQTVTSVQVLSQKSRSLASAASVVRDIDETQAKPETGSVKTLLSLPMKQVASIESGTPNVILAQAGFASMVETDLRLAILAGYDKIVLDAIAGASPGQTSPGADLVASVRQAVEDVAAAGYVADVALLSPDQAIALDLLQDDAGRYYWAPGSSSGPLFGLRIHVSPQVTDAMVADSAAFGRMYATGLALASFEEEAGSTNCSTVRLEGHAAFGIGREDALTKIPSSS